MRTTKTRLALPIFAALAVIGLASTGSALAATPSPVYVHMNGLNDFLPKVIFARPGQPVIFVNQDQGPHSIHAYDPVGGRHLKALDDVILQGTPGPGHKVHTYKVTFNHPGVHYYICTVHAHLVPVYKTASGETYDLPAKREGVHGYRGSMAGVVIVTNEAALLKSNPPITHRRILKKFWNNGDVTGK